MFAYMFACSCKQIKEFINSFKGCLQVCMID